MQFQIIFNPISAAELAKMPRELQLNILGEFRGLPQEVLTTDLEQFGKLERSGRILQLLSTVRCALSVQYAGVLFMLHSCAGLPVQSCRRH